MEAQSVPAESGGDPGEAPGGQSPAVDLSPVLDRVGEIGQSVDQFNQRLEQFEQRLGQPEGDGYGDEYGDDPYGPDPEGADPFDPDGFVPDGEEMSPEQAQRWLDGVISKRAEAIAQQQVQQQVEPLMEQLDDLMADRTADEILAEFPEFADEERGKQFMEHAAGLVEQMGLPDEIAQKLVTSAPFLRTVAQATRQGQGERKEEPATETQDHPLEPAGGASLGGGEPDLARGIVQAGGGNRFWGT